MSTTAPAKTSRHKRILWSVLALIALPFIANFLSYGCLADLFFEREYRCEKQAKDPSQPYAYDELKRYAKDFGLNMKDFQLANISMTYSHGHYDFKVTYCHPQYGFYFNSAYPRGTVEYASLVELTNRKFVTKKNNSTEFWQSRR